MIWFAQEVSQGGCEALELKNPCRIRHACFEQVRAPAPALSYRRILYTGSDRRTKVAAAGTRQNGGAGGRYQNKTLPGVDILV